MYVCFDGVDGFVNLKFRYNDNEYLFTEFIPKKIDQVVFLKEYLN